MVANTVICPAQDELRILDDSPVYRQIDLAAAELRSIALGLDGNIRSRLEAVERTLSGILASAAPALTPLAEWTTRYREILRERGLADATLSNRESALRPLDAALGHIALGAIRPYDLAQFISGYTNRGALHAARYALSVIQDLFYEATAAGLIDRHPGIGLRPVRAGVTRDRLSLAMWHRAYERASLYAPWVQRSLELALVTAQRRAEIAAFRFDHIRGRFLHVVQAKTGARLRLHLDITLDAVGLSIGDVVERCRGGAPGPHLIRHHESRGSTRAGAAIHRQTLSNRFAQLIQEVGGPPPGRAPTLHEQRSLAARLYRQQGRNPQLLLGHRRAATTDMYLDSRGAEWIEVT